MVDARICSEKIFLIPKKKVGKFIINKRNDDHFFKKKEESHDKLSGVLIELIKANNNPAKEQAVTLTTSPSVKSKTVELEKGDSSGENDPLDQSISELLVHNL